MSEELRIFCARLFLFLGGGIDLGLKAKAF